MISTAILKSLASSKKEKNILITIKSCFAFSWGFISAVIFLISKRYVTMMTGNVLLLAISVQDWNVDEMLVTLVWILAYVLSAALYNYISILFSNNQDRVLRYLIPSVIFLGVLADFLQYKTKACASASTITKDDCVEHQLHFLTPISMIAGLVAAGYCQAHPDGICTSMLTDHVTKPVTNILKMMSKDCPDRKILREQASISFIIVVSFFLGVLPGKIATDLVYKGYSLGLFTPVFTCFGAVMAILCTMHHIFYMQYIIMHIPKEKNPENVNDTTFNDECDTSADSHL